MGTSTRSDTTTSRRMTAASPLPLPRSFLLVWLCLAMIMIPSSRAEPRSIYVRGALQIEYTAETAQFGDPLNQSLYANLMLPPDNPWLCEFPASLENISATELANEPEFQFTQDIALFVSMNRCSAETKARVAVQMQERITDRIRLLVLYSTNPQDFSFVSVTSDNGDDPPELSDIGIVFIPHRYASGIDLRMRMQYQGDDPRFSYDTSENWNFPIEVTELSDTARPHAENTGVYEGGDIYWFRVILFSILIASPCFRACYLWYAGGGRLHWRRNEQGRIIGIQYIPPMPLWLATVRPGNEASSTTTVLTEEQFNSLPEIVYKGAPAKSDYDPDEAVEEEDPPTGAETCTSSDVKSGSDEDEDHISSASVDEIDVEAGTGPASTVDTCENGEHGNDDALEEAVIDVPSDVVNTESSEKEVDVPVDAVNSESCEAEIHVPSDSAPAESEEAEIDVPSQAGVAMSDVNFLEENGAQDDMVESNEGNDVESTLDTRPAEAPVEDENALPADAKDASEEAEETSIVVQCEDVAPVNASMSAEVSEKETISTSCAICIDEFENGEKLTLLPRCKHAFHPECIKEWLMERQGCCPLCKVDVLESNPEESPAELDLEAPVEQRIMISSM